MSPEAVAALVWRAGQNRRFWILTVVQTADCVVERASEIVAAAPR